MALKRGQSSPKDAKSPNQEGNTMKKQLSERVCNIKVSIRVRPMLKTEIMQGQKCTRIISDEEKNELQYEPSRILFFNSFFS